MNLYIYSMIAVFIFFNFAFAIGQSQKNNGLIDIMGFKISLSFI